MERHSPFGGGRATTGDRDASNAPATRVVSSQERGEFAAEVRNPSPMAARKSFVLGIVALALGIAVFGQKPPQPAAGAPLPPGAPTVDQIIDHYQRAVGGRAAWRKLTSRSSMGTVEIPSMNLSGTVVIHEKAPDKILTIIIIAGSAFRQGFDGSVGWAEDPQDGLREQAGAELAETKRQADFYSPFDLREHYAKLVSLGSERMGEREVYVLEATLPDGGQPEKLYFDAESGLPARIVNQRHTAEGASEFREEFSDYRDVDGAKLPFTIFQAGGGSEFTVRISEVRHNITFEDSEFAKPAVQ